MRGSTAYNVTADSFLVKPQSYCRGCTARAEASQLDDVQLDKPVENRSKVERGGQAVGAVKLCSIPRRFRPNDQRYSFCTPNADVMTVTSRPDAKVAGYNLSLTGGYTLEYIADSSSCPC